jgi:hypothetical protein
LCHRQRGPSPDVVLAKEESFSLRGRQAAVDAGKG